MEFRSEDEEPLDLAVVVAAGAAGPMGFTMRLVGDSLPPAVEPGVHGIALPLVEDDPIIAVIRYDLLLSRAPASPGFEVWPVDSGGGTCYDVPRAADQVGWI